MTEIAKSIARAFGRAFGQRLVNPIVAGSGGAAVSAILLESGDYLLLESGDYILLEA